MWIFYVIAIIPFLIGTAIFCVRKEVNWQEWIGTSASAFALAAMAHGMAIHGMTADHETWSGRMCKAVHYPEWVEEYHETHTRTVGSGKNAHTVTYTDTHHRTHYKHWNIETTLGQDIEVEQSFYNEVVKDFGGEIIAERVYKSGFDSGDHNIYNTVNKTGIIKPVTTQKNFENRIKAAPTVFSFATVPDGTKVYEYPDNPSWYISGRLLGNVPIDILEFDRMNARLGPSKRVNVIMVRLGSQDLAQWQRAKWVGGKKNDLVLCYGGSDPRKAEWSYVFGWTEREVVKRNLETILMENPINNTILPIIEQEIKSNYLIKDWHKFDYITITPRVWHVVTYVIIVFIVFAGLQVWCIVNEFNKEGDRNVNEVLRRSGYRGCSRGLDSIRNRLRYRR